jgi:hypothetical protein
MATGPAEDLIVVLDDDPTGSQTVHGVEFSPAQPRRRRWRGRAAAAGAAGPWVQDAIGKDINRVDTRPYILYP